MTERLSPERLAAIRMTAWPRFGPTVQLLAHIDAQQAEIARLEGMVAALRRELIDLGLLGLDHHPDCDGDDDCFCQRLDALADTEAATKAHDQRERLDGARPDHAQRNIPDLMGLLRESFGLSADVRRGSERG